MDTDNRIPELFGQVCAFDRLHGLTHSETGAFLGQLAENHVRVLQKILVDRIAEFGLADMQPVLVDLDRMVSLLQKENVRNDVRSRIGAKGIVRQSNRAEQFGPLRDVLSHRRIRFIHRSAGGNERDHASGTNLVQRFCKEIVVNQKMILVVPLVGKRVVPERYVANGYIEEAVRIDRFFKALNANVRVLITIQRSIQKPTIHKCTDEKQGIWTIWNLWTKHD